MTAHTPVLLGPSESPFQFRQDTLKLRVQILHALYVFQADSESTESGTSGHSGITSEPGFGGRPTSKFYAETSSEFPSSRQSGCYDISPISLYVLLGFETRSQVIVILVPVKEIQHPDTSIPLSDSGFIPIGQVIESILLFNCLGVL